MTRLARPFTLAAVVMALLAAVFGLYLKLVADDGDAALKPIVTAQAERRTLRQTIVANGSVHYPRLGTLLSASGGRVTSVNVAVGRTVAAGDPVLSIDGRPSIAVPGAIPFWRDIRFGESGPDIRQLEEALAAEGYDPGPIDETFTGATDSALRSWQAAHGFPVDGVFRAADAFPGEWPARVGRIHVVTGQFIARGAELVTLTSNELEVTLDLAPSQRLQVQEGLPVTLEVGGTRALMQGTLGSIVEVAPQGPEGNTSYVATVLIDGQIRAIDGAPVAGVVTLAEAADAVAVPVAAIVLNGQGETAVQVRNAGGDVTLVSVTTGLAEGAFVQVTSGLAGGERVLLEQPK